MSNVPLFVASEKRITAQLAKLRECGAEEWEMTYIDPVTQEKWTKLRLWDHHGSGQVALRRGTPTAEEIVARIAETEFPDEAAAGAWYLAHWIDDGFEYFESLLEQLEQRSKVAKTSTALRCIALVLVWSGMQQPFNHRTTVGKEYAQIEADYRYFSEIAERAARLSAHVERGLGQASTSDISVFR